ncbi:Alpha/Beta hydrolase protein [Hyaloraphidium curvatum]|nr:Alpha/Beta hydrolase protein [Hyaloraphidium curvatum]
MAQKYPPPSDISFTSFQGLRIAARRWGYIPNSDDTSKDNESAKDTDRTWIRILACHGWLDNCHTWNKLIPTLLHDIEAANPSLKCTVVCLDLPGHGLSDHRSKDSDYADMRYAIDVEACVQALNWRSFVLMGHSMGGAVSCFYATAYPNRIQAMILVDNVGPFTRPAQQIPEEILERIEEEKVLSRKRKPRYASVHEATLARTKAPRIPLGYEGASHLVARGLMEIVEEDSSMVSDPFQQKVRVVATVASSPDGRRPEDQPPPVHDKPPAEPERKRAYTWRTDQRLTMTEPFPPTEATCLEILKRIGRARVPVLLILASGGYFVRNIEQGQGLRWEKRFWALAVGAEESAVLEGEAGRGGAKVVILPGGHHLHLEEQADTCANLIADMLVRTIYHRDTGLFEGKLRVEWRGVPAPDEGRSGRVLAGLPMPLKLPAKL